MIDEMMLVFDSPGSVLRVFIIAFPIQRSEKCARGRRRPQTTEMCRAGFYALGRSELVGCGVRLGHQGSAASLQDESARAMPTPNNE